jgi:hypothetical protein
VQVVTSDDAIGQESKEGPVRFRGQMSEGVLYVRNVFHVPILADGIAKDGSTFGDFQLFAVWCDDAWWSCFSRARDRLPLDYLTDGHGSSDGVVEERERRRVPGERYRPIHGVVVERHTARVVRDAHRTVDRVP